MRPDVEADRATWGDLKAAARQRHLPAGAVPLERVQSTAEREYRGTVVQTGPTPEHLEPLADYVARATSEATGGPETCEHGYPEGDCDQFGCDPLCAHGCADGDCPDTGCPFTHQSPATAGPLPPATDSPARASVKRSATRPGTLPCEVCGSGVTLAYIERTGRQRHGHHPEAAE
jgi:hypothetical protein